MTTRKAKKEKPVFGEWQLCPKCLGIKTAMLWDGTGYFQSTCDICGGTGIVQKPILNLDKI